MESWAVIGERRDDRGYVTWGLGGGVRKGLQNDVRSDKSRMETEEKLKQRQVVRPAGASPARRSNSSIQI